MLCRTAQPHLRSFSFATAPVHRSRPATLSVFARAVMPDDHDSTLHDQLRNSSFLRAKRLQTLRDGQSQAREMQRFAPAIEHEVLRSQVFLLSDVPPGVEATELQEARMQEVLCALATHGAASQFSQLCGYWQVTYPVQQAGFGRQSCLKRLRGSVTVEMACESIEVTHRHLVLLPEASTACEVLQFQADSLGECYVVDSATWHLKDDQLTLIWRNEHSFFRAPGENIQAPLMPRSGLETACPDTFTVRYVDDALCILQTHQGRLLPLLANPDYAADS